MKTELFIKNGYPQFQCSIELNVDGNFYLHLSFDEVIEQLKRQGVGYFGMDCIEGDPQRQALIFISRFPNNGNFLLNKKFTHIVFDNLNVSKARITES